MTTYGDCTYCGGEVAEKKIEYDYRCAQNLMAVNNVPAGGCQECGEKYFRPEVLKRMDEIYHDIFDRRREPERTLTIPAVSL